MPVSRPWRLLAGLAAGVLAGGAGLLFAQAAHSATTSPLRATYEVPDATKKGYDVQFTVVNTGKTAVTGWKVEFDLPSGTGIGKAKNAVLTRSGTNHYALANKKSNATVAAGASRAFSFIA
ncbi:MAG: chitinase, partial [Actinobacteria bacterium]